MAVSIVTSTSTTDTDSNTSMSVAVPSGLTTGDLWLVCVVVDQDGGWTIALPSGWTSIFTTIQGAVGWPAMRAFAKIAGASESAVTVTWSGTGDSYDAWAASLRITGHHATNWLGNVGTAALPSGEGSTIDAPDITIQDNGNLALLFAACEGDSTPAIDFSSVPSGSTLVVRRDGSNVFPSAGVAQQAVNAGSYAPGTWGQGNDQGRIGQTVEIRAAATGTTVANRKLLLLGVGC